MARYLTLLFILYSLFIVPATFSYASSLQSPRFQINESNVDIDIKEQPSFYTLKTRFGNEWLADFNSKGYFLRKEDSFVETKISSNLMHFGQLNAYKEAEDSLFIEFPASNTRSEISILQMYPMKNINGDLIADLQYSISNGSYRILPDENKGDLPAALFSVRTDVAVRNEISFRIMPPSSPKSTYETTISIEILPIY